MVKTRGKANTMRGHAITYLRRHPLKGSLLLALFVFALFLLASHLLNLARWKLFDYRFQQASLAEPTGTATLHSWPVSYTGGLFRVRVHVYRSEIEHGRALNTAWVFGSSGSVRERYVRSIVTSQSRNRLVGELSTELRGIRRRLRLDDDEYLELLVRTVQAIPYGTIEPEIAMPAEVIAEGQGTCAEKSVLLGALMLHEGYDTAVFVLDSQRHAALGVRTDGPGYRDLPFAFVETTQVARIGEVRPLYLRWGPVLSPPQTIEIGGTKRYGGADSRSRL